jgi:hypothetical protein
VNAVLKIHNKKFYLTLSTAIVILISAYFLLDNSFTANKFVFSNFIIPYNPLDKRQFKSDSILIIPENTWKDPRGLFPIFAFNLPERTKNLTASLKVIEKGGINIIINGNMGWMPDPYKVKEAFEKLEGTNLRWLAIIENECKNDFIYRNSNDDINGNIRKYLNDFNGNYVYGWYLWDEPGNNRKLCSPMNLIPNDDNEDINRMGKQIRSDSVFNKKLDFVNLFPTYWSETPTPAYYEKYIDAFISSQEYKPRVLCFDHYPNLKETEGGFRKDFYSNLSVIREKSLEYDIPFWMIVLSSEHLSYRKPSFEDISLQVYSALAYGAKGIGYYLYSKSWENVGYKSWILEDYVDDTSVSDSLHGPLFVPVQNLNSVVQVLGKILSELNSIDVIHTSDYPNNQKDIAQSIFKKDVTGKVIQEIQPAKNLNSDSKILLGVFENKKDTVQNGRYLLVVNKDVLTSSEFQIKLNKLYKLYKFNKETGEKVFIAYADDISTTISPGSGELFYIE